MTTHSVTTARPLVLALAFALASAPATASDDDGVTERVSLGAGGAQGNANSGTGIGSAVTLSGDGRYAAFVSAATNLVSGDTNGQADIFVHDRDTNTTTRVSVATGGAQANGQSTHPRMSLTGTFVVFQSTATNLVTGDINGWSDVFRHNLLTGTTELVSTTGIGPGNGSSESPTISDFGRYVAFWSAASNLVGGDSNATGDCFVRDMILGITRRVSVQTGGGQGNGNSRSPSISPDGRYVVFSTAADNLAGFDGNGHVDILIHDRILLTTERVGPSPNWNGGSDEPVVSADGLVVAFESDATNIVGNDMNGLKDVFVHDRATNLTRRVSENGGTGGDGASRQPSISADGRFIAYRSFAENLAPGNNGWEDIFVHDRTTFTNAVVSLDQNGNPANGLSGHPSISEDGAFVAFVSFASDLVPGDSNAHSDVFVRLCFAPEPEIYCDTSDNSLGCVPSIIYAGTPSATAGNGFILRAVEVLNNQFGIMFYGIDGAAAIPFGFGTVCVAPPHIRTAVQNSQGSPPPAADCSGVFVLDFNERIASGVDATLVVGQKVWAQFWSRDPGYAPPNGTSLTNGIAFTIGP